MIISTLFFTVFIHSCSDDFLTEGWKPPEWSTVIITPCIYVLPDEDAKPCVIGWEEAGNADFTIVSKPYWLKVESMKGKFMNGIAEITCSAIRNNLFTEDQWIYVAIMTLEVDGIGNVFVEVGYNNGRPGYPSDPVFVRNNSEIIDFGMYETLKSVYFGNKGNSVLIWKVIDCPEWINLEKEIDFLYRPKLITFTCNRSGLDEGDYEGVLKITTNEKNNPIHEIPVRCEVRR